MEVLHIYWL